MDCRLPPARWRQLQNVIKSCLTHRRDGPGKSFYFRAQSVGLWTEIKRCRRNVRKKLMCQSDIWRQHQTEIKSRLAHQIGTQVLIVECMQDLDLKKIPKLMTRTKGKCLRCWNSRINFRCRNISPLTFYGFVRVECTCKKEDVSFLLRIWYLLKAGAK